MTIGAVIAIIGVVVWATILLLPWQPWSTRERLDANGCNHVLNPDDITALVPARNESSTIAETLRGLTAQHRNIQIVLVDDQSTDGTADAARSVSQCNLKLVQGKPLPQDWVGKMWALDQGFAEVSTENVLLIDADIKLEPGMLAAMKHKMDSDNIDFLSLMVALRMDSFWERLLMPAFVYFFKLLYPFRLSNNPQVQGIAAGAGGCILLKAELVRKIGGFGSLKDILIDDCALAKRAKKLGYRTWIGLTHSACSTRVYESLGSIWNMVARNAFTELKYSVVRLLICTVLMVIIFWSPIAGLLIPGLVPKVAALCALILMMLSYCPTLRFYGMRFFWALALPLIGSLYLAMTWSSAIRYWLGRRFRWRGRLYGNRGMGHT
ncbi:MAG: glycosyltransferase [Gammaproteobacteria bacterium]|nr:glycosyltransferase [Gammaproteobacteria bacterium]